MAYNLITGSGNFTLLATDCLIGSASWTGSTTRDQLYVQGLLKTDIFYPILGTSSLFVAKMNFSGSGATYNYQYTGALSGSVTELQSGSYSDYYVDTWWGVPYDYLYTFDPYVTRSISDGGQWTDVAGGAWKQGYHYAFLRRKSDKKIVSMCAVYPVSSSTGVNNVNTYVSPGVGGFFCMTTGAGGIKADIQNETAAGFAKKAELRLLAGNVIIASTEDAPPEPEPEPPSEVTFSFNPYVRRFSSIMILSP